MTDLATLEKLRDRVREATGPDRELDAQIWLALTDGATRKTSVVKSDKGLWPDYTIDETRDATGWLITVPAYTVDLSAAVALVKQSLPGWWWRIGACHLSDDATIGPDHNDPAHAERLRREFPPDYINEAGDKPFDGGIDVDRRPAGNVALALCEALLTALIEIERTGPRSNEISAAVSAIRHRNGSGVARYVRFRMDNQRHQRTFCLSALHQLSNQGRARQNASRPMQGTDAQCDSRLRP